MAIFDRTEALQLLARFEDDKDASAVARTHVVLADTDVEAINHFNSTDYATGLAEQLKAVLELLDRLQRDEDVAESTAMECAERAQRTAHPALSGELRHMAGYAAGAAAYARFLRTGEMDDDLSRMLS